MIPILVIDNYDSFTYNLVHYLEDLNASVTVKRNNAFTLDEVASYKKIILSPGPGLPQDKGLIKDVIDTYASTKSILGICLGHQAIGEHFGGKLYNLKTVYHGVSSQITTVVANETLFNGLPKTFKVGRYHSWVISQELPEVLEVTSVDKQGVIMSLRHKSLDVKGLQFHPESILTPLGKHILKNWLES